MYAGDELITAQELADSLSFSVDTIWRYIWEKKIPCVEISNRQYRYNRQGVLKALSGVTNPIPAREEPVTFRGEKKLTYSN